MNLDYDMKLRDAFPNLQGVELNIEEFDLPVRIYNTLKRCKINSLQELLSYSCNEILAHKGTGMSTPRNNYIKSTNKMSMNHRDRCPGCL